jgi:hypothetical protein
MAAANLQAICLESANILGVQHTELVAKSHREKSKASRHEAKRAKAYHAFGGAVFCAVSGSGEAQVDAIAAVKATVGMIAGAGSSNAYAGTPEDTHRTSSGYPLQIGKETAPGGSSAGASVPQLDEHLLEAGRAFFAVRPRYLFEINKLVNEGDVVAANMHERWMQAKPMIMDAFQFLKRKGHLGERMWQVAVDLFDNAGELLHAPFPIPPGNSVIDRAFRDKMAPMLESIGFSELPPALLVPLPPVTDIDVASLRAAQHTAEFTVPPGATPGQQVTLTDGVQVMIPQGAQPNENFIVRGVGLAVGETVITCPPATIYDSMYIFEHVLMKVGTFKMTHSPAARLDGGQSRDIR